MSKRLVAALLAVAALVAACGGDDGAPEVVRPAQPVWCPTDRDPNGVRLRGVTRGDFDARRLLGRPEDEARRIARAAGCEVRVARRDGEGLPGIANLDSRRINVAVTDGRVVEIISVG